MSALPGREDATNPLAGLVQTQEVDLHEARTHEDFQDALSNVLSSDLPGFVIRGEGLDNHPFNKSVELTELVEGSLLVLGHVFERGRHLRDTGMRPQFGIGRLHIDVESGRSVQALDLHTTVQGAGRVILAESGERVRRLLESKGTPQRTAQEKQLGNYLLAGLVDPAMISPTLYTTLLDAGDHVIFPLANVRGPVWHRFDTASESREIDMWVLDRKLGTKPASREARQPSAPLRAAR